MSQLRWLDHGCARRITTTSGQVPVAAAWKCMRSPPFSTGDGSSDRRQGAVRMADNACCTQEEQAMAQEKNENVRSVARALEILLAFTPQDFELTAAELMTRVALSRPTLYRFLYTLQELGLLVAVGEPQRFRLGPAVAKLAHTWSASLDVATIAEPVLRRIWNETLETVGLF
eukprot:gene11935-15185_t